MTPTPLFSEFPPAPLARIPRVTHIGTLNPAHKGNRGDSHEGEGLSVSRHPEAWEAIAQLGGFPWWESESQHLRFLDGHRFLERARTALETWGIREGWVTPGQAHVVGWLDLETEERRSAWFPTLPEAQAEHALLEEDPDSEATLGTWATVIPTPKLMAFMGHHRAVALTPSVFDDLATAWAHDQKLDGVWWADRLDPDSLSAPRGVVFPERVDSLSWTCVQPDASEPVALKARSRRP